MLGGKRADDPYPLLPKALSHPPSDLPLGICGPRFCHRTSQQGVARTLGRVNARMLNVITLHA